MKVNSLRELRAWQRVAPYNSTWHRYYFDVFLPKRLLLNRCYNIRCLLESVSTENFLVKINFHIHWWRGANFDFCGFQYLLWRNFLRAQGCIPLAYAYTYIMLYSKALVFRLTIHDYMFQFRAAVMHSTKLDSSVDERKTQNLLCLFCAALATRVYHYRLSVISGMMTSNQSENWTSAHVRE